MSRLRAIKAFGALVGASGVLVACGSSSSLRSSKQEDSGEARQGCPARQPAPSPLPGVRPEHRSAAYWIDRQPEPDAVVLSPAAIEAHNRALASHDAAHPEADPLTQIDLTRPVDRAALARELDARLRYVRERVDRGEYLLGGGARLPEAARAVLAVPAEPPAAEAALRVSLGPIPLRCAPVPDALYGGPEGNASFDRNSCSTIRPQEPVLVLGRWAGGMLLARTRYALGWVAADARLSPPVPAEHARLVVTGPQLVAHGEIALHSDHGANLEVPDRTRLPSAGEGRALFATPDGLALSQPLGAAQAVPTTRPLTRRAVIEEAFAYLDTPYGWGGQGGGRDCSGFVMDVLGSFGLELPRHSGLQAQAGSMRIDLSGARDEAERLSVLDAAAARGVVLLHFPGHIMLYLGRSREGTPMAMHAFAEYLEPCAPADAGASERRETLRQVDRVQVSDLELGRGSSRRSFLERITAVTLFADAPGSTLVGLVARRPAAPLTAPEDGCRDSDEVSMLLSPARPHVGAPVRVVVASARDLGSVRLELAGPDGQTHVPPLHTLGGPPFGYWAELDGPAAGSWQARLGEAERVEACRRFEVYPDPPKRQAGGGAVWQPRRRWTQATEQLYSIWVEQLFAYPLDDRNWNSLQELLAVRDHNLLFDYLGQDEDRRLRLQPDCADLPYFLRAYFAWKLKLPFAFRHCNRGSRTGPPYCDRDVKSNLMERETSGEVEAFAAFARGPLADGVHSGSGRTSPRDDHTDYYPVALSRETIPPGTMYADPYGHLYVIARWEPQTVGGYGKLIGADGQPDGTIGRRRFWRGSFLFTPDTTLAGAGFKHFRPTVLGGGAIKALGNDAIAGRAGYPPPSMQQYEVDQDGFYDAVEGLINPRPLDPSAMLEVLVAALSEQVQRRVVSIDIGEKYKASHPGAIAMPSGHAIFETEGPWEDFATPSRDMRLLIAIDTVTGFPAVVRRRPERYAVSADRAETAAAALRAELGRRLGASRFAYTRSDGQSQSLSLQDVVDRAAGLEVAYNPNDCVEVRWAAPEGPGERAGCKRLAPAEQRKRMAEYRRWFAERKRPPR